jgi:hypothetical protein
MTRPVFASTQTARSSSAMLVHGGAERHATTVVGPGVRNVVDKMHPSIKPKGTSCANQTKAWTWATVRQS